MGRTWAFWAYLLALFSSTAFAQNFSFTYQGRLADSGQAAGGIYDFHFILTDAPIGGNRLIPPFTNTAVTVTNGLFTTPIIFPVAAFDGAGRWLEIAVRTNGGAGIFTMLSPRQPITAAPYSAFAASAGTAALAADLIGGGASLTSVPAASLTGNVSLARLAGITSSQLDAAAWQPVSTGLTATALQAAQSVSGYSFSLSANTANLPHLHSALTSGGPVRILWLGDSIGGDTVAAVVNLFEACWKNGIQRGAPFLGYPRYYTYQTAGWGEEASPDFWSTIYVLTNGAWQVWGGPAGGYVPADKCSFWYLGDPTSGSAQIDVSTNNVSWQTLGTVNTSIGLGLRVTNFSIPPAAYSVRVISLGGGTKNRIRYAWAGLMNSGQTKCLIASSCTGNGRDLGVFLGMGEATIATILTNLNPDLIIYEQKKDVWTRSNWPAVAGLFKTYASNADVCLLSGQISNGGNDPPATNPTNNSLAVALVDRAIALSNGWAYVDNYTPLNDWTNIVMANGFNADNTVHFNQAGQFFSGSILVRELGLVDYLLGTGQASGLDLGITTTIPVIVPGGRTNQLQFTRGRLTGIIPR